MTVNNTNLNANGTAEIVVVESGFVFLAGKVEQGSQSDEWKLHDASVIREWGTTAGLGEIALHGPTTKTVLDYCGTPTVPKGKVLFRLPCTY